MDKDTTMTARHGLVLADTANKCNECIPGEMSFSCYCCFFSELRLAQTVQPSKIAIAKTFMERSACLKRAFVHERFLQCYFSL